MATQTTQAAAAGSETITAKSERIEKLFYRSWDLYSIREIPNSEKKSWQFMGKGHDRNDGSIEIHQNFISGETKLQLRYDKKTKESLAADMALTPRTLSTSWTVYYKISGKGKTFWIEAGKGFTNKDCSINLLVNCQTIGIIKLVAIEGSDPKPKKNEEIYGKEIEGDEIPLGDEIPF